MHELLNNRTLSFTSGVGDRFALVAEVDLHAWEQMDRVGGEVRAVWQPIEINVYENYLKDIIAMGSLDVAFAEDDPEPDAHFGAPTWLGDYEKKFGPDAKAAIWLEMVKLCDEMLKTLALSARRAISDLDKPKKRGINPIGKYAAANFSRCVTRRCRSRQTGALAARIEHYVKSARCWYLIDSLSSTYPKTWDELLGEFSDLVAKRPDVYTTSGYKAVYRAYYYGHPEILVMYDLKGLAYADLSGMEFAK